MSKLIANRAILYQNRLYAAGDELPQCDAMLARAWLAAGSARADTANAPEKAGTTAPANAPEKAEKRPAK